MRALLHSDSTSLTSRLAVPLRNGLTAATGLRSRIAAWVRRAGYRPERHYMRGAPARHEGRPSSAIGRG